MATNDIERISQLLNKAENTSNAHEREAFYAAAQKLAIRSQIDLDMARLYTKEGEQSKRVPIKMDVEVGVAKNRGAGTLIELLMKICDVNEVRWISWGNSRLTMYGTKEQLDSIVMFYNILSYQMTLDCDEFLEKEEWREEGVTKLDARKSFCYGFRTRIGQRLAQARAEAIREAEDHYEDTSVALVLANTQKESDRLFWNDSRNLQTRQTSTGTSRRGHGAGRESANRARITKSQGLESTAAVEG